MREAQLFGGPRDGEIVEYSGPTVSFLPEGVGPTPGLGYCQPDPAATIRYRRSGDKDREGRIMYRFHRPKKISLPT